MVYSLGSKVVDMEPDMINLCDLAHPKIVVEKKILAIPSEQKSKVSESWSEKICLLSGIALCRFSKLEYRATIWMFSVKKSFKRNNSESLPRGRVTPACNI